MHRMKLGDQNLRRVAILRALQLGDLLCAVPALRALRAELPEAHITLIGLPWSQVFIKRFSHYLDEFLEFPGIPGFPEREPQIHHFPSFLEKAQQQRYDLVLQMQGSGNISNTLAALFGARLTAGFFLQGGYCPNPERFLIYPEHETEVWRHLRLMEFLGVPLSGDELEFPLRPEDWDALRPILEENHLEPGGFICLHPGARAESRRWPVERFAATGDALSEAGLKIVLTGSEAEAPLTRAVARNMKARAIDLTGQTELGALGALYSITRLLVCNDTGVSHLAAALKTPSVVLFSDSDPNRWAPLDRSLHRIVEKAGEAGPEAVLNEARTLLAMDLVYDKS